MVRLRRIGYVLLLTILFCTVAGIVARAQLSGTKYVPGDYATVTAAVAALNTSGVGSGGVIINVTANYTETISATISLTATGTSANPITIQKDPGTSGANPLITAYTGGTATPASTTQDGIFRLSGSDYVTISGIDLAENAANTSNPSTMEYGYALYKASVTNGCQYVTIKNCVVTLSNINNAAGTAPMSDGSSGIIVMNATAAAATTTLTPTSAAGTNSYNKFYGNTVQNCNTGIALIGYAAASPFTLADVSNDVGGNAAGTGNIILNFGGASGATVAAVGIRTLAQYGLNVAYNTLNSNNGLGAPHATTLRGIYTNTATSAAMTISNNTVTVAGGGTTQNVSGIENAAGSTAASNTITISNNTVTNSTYATATTGGFYGIYNVGTPAALVVTGNTISNNSSAATTTGFFYGIYNNGAASIATINSNTISGNSAAALTSGAFMGISNAAATPVLVMKSNTFANNASSSTAGFWYALYNSGASATSINLDSNIIGTAAGGTSATFTAANSGSQLLLYNKGGAATATLSITGNVFRNLNYAVAGTGSVTFITNSAATLSQTINGNVFASLDVNTVGSVTFISNNVAVPATGTQDVSGNSISGTFNKSGVGGTLTLFTSSASSVSGSVINNNNNNFSNITVSGATTIAGWVNTDAGASTKTTQGNTFSNWIGGTAGITAMNMNVTGTSNATTGNLINNMSCACTLQGIATAAGNDNIYGNVINSLTTTGALNVAGIVVTAGTVKNIYGNKIYDLQASVNGGSAYGVSVTGTSGAVVTLNLYNNVIGDLRAPATSSTSDLVRGINITSTRASSNINVYYNTVYLNTSSTGANFSTTGIYHTVSATATTAKLTMRNNIIANFSAANGSGLAVAYRRSGTSLGNYATNSNNNLLYAGAQSATHLLFYNGTNSGQSLAAYRALVTPIDAQTVTEDLSANFLSTSGASADFLHLNPAIATQAESGGANISGFTTDYDGNTRQANAGYAGSGTAPDIGADEMNGIQALPLSGIITVGTGGTYPSLTQNGGLFADINSLGLSNDVTVQIISDLTENGVNSLNAWDETGVGNYSLTIQPNSAVTRVISGNVAGPLIDFNGTDRVTIDGRYGGSGKYLTFRNTNTGGTTATALTLINGATNNTIEYAAFEAYGNATNSVVLFSTSASVAGGNSNNTISNCNINATVSGNTGYVGIYSAGTATAGYENSSNTISGNNIYDFRDKGIDITATGTTGWTISGNSIYNGNVASTINYAAATSLYGLRILGGAGYAISNNYIGGSAANAGGTAATYGATAGLLSYWGMLITTSSATPASNIKGNTLANIIINVVPTSTSSNVFMGLESNGSGINIGGSAAGEGNTIGSSTANGSIQITTTTAASNYKTTLRGINCNSTGGQIIGNTVGGIDIKNVGTVAGPSTFSGICVTNVAPPSQINNNVVGAAAVTNSIRVLSTSACVSTAMYGINLSSTITGTVQADGNTIQNMSHLSSANTSGAITGIISAAAGTAAVSITNNTISSNYIATNTTGPLYGISNTGAATTLTITGNTLVGASFGAAAGLYSAIINSGAVTGTITINSNYIGTSGSPALTTNVLSTATQTFISNAAGAATAALSISNNNFQNIVYSTASSGANIYISNTAATLSQAINGNTFTNLNVNTSGSITFISNSVIVGATGTQNVNNNAIVTGFTKRAGGTVTFFTSSATSVAGGVVNNNNNNFSNITVTGATIITGWVNTDAGAATKTIQGNTFSNWSCGTSAITAMSVNLTSGSNATTANLINGISASAAIIGIATAAGNDAIYGNTINTLAATGNFAVTGISVTAGTTKNIYKNKIYDLSSSGATGSVNGIATSGSTLVTANIYNNIIGDLRVPAGNSATDLVRGIAIGSTTASSAANVYYNTIYLNAASTGTTFGTSGIYHTVSATATTAALTLRNNVVVNVSTPKGTGVSVAYRRSGTALNNYVTASNNNLFYAGTPGATKLIFFDGTNSDQTLATYKTRVVPRDSSSVTDDLSSKFLSTTGSSGVYLHVSSTAASLVESGAVNIAGFTDDYDGQVRQGNAGYSGTGYAPDIGADEVFGIEAIPPTIAYTPFTNTTSTSNRTLSSVTITDGSGVNATAGTKPRIYYKRFRDANTFADNTPNTNGWKYTEATNSSSPFSFTIDYSLMYGGASVTVGEIQYFIVAQDLATIANVGINSGSFNTTPASVALTATAFPIGGTINSFDIPFSGTYNVGGTEVFTSLTKIDGLFGSINRVGLKGNTTIYVTSDLSEDGYYQLNQWTETGGSNYRLTIVPDAATTRIISGSSTTGLIRFDGADRVTIDGSNGGAGQYLTFRNTSTLGTTGTAFTFINGATTDTIRYCNAEAYTDATDGVVLFSTSTASGGNSSDVIDNCNINVTVSSNTGSAGIYSAGTAGFENSANTVSNCNIYNYRDRGLDITATGTTGWTISGNSFYNGTVAGAINYAAATALHGIRILGGAGYNVLNNYIGGSAALASGSNAVYSSTLGNVSYEGIVLTTTNALPASAIKGNKITKISVSSVPSAAGSLAFTGIETGNAGVSIGGSGSGEGNIIGSNTVNGAIAITTTTASSSNTSLVYGVNCASSGGSIIANQAGGVDITNIGAAPAASAFYGIYINAPTAPSPVRSNVVGSVGTGAANNSVRVRSVSLATDNVLYGIAISSTVSSTVTLDSNTIQNVANRSTTSSGAFTGIADGAATTANIAISSNNVKNITTGVNASASSTIYTGIDASSPAVISYNTVDNISVSSTGNAAQIRGISLSGSNAFTLSGNTISNLSTASVKTADLEADLPSNYNVIGILSNSSASGLVIAGNNMHDFSSTTTAVTNTAVAGIGLQAGSGDVYNNHMSVYTNTAAGTTTLPGIGGIKIAGGSFNVYNTVVSLDNSFNANGLKIYGINHASASNCNYYYNTVNIAGSATGAAARSAAFVRSAGSTLLLRNSVLVNSRSGTGSNYAISNLASPASLNWSATTSDYNNLYSATSATLAEWGAGTSQTFAQWQTSSSGGTHSVNRAVSFITSTYDLEPDGITNCGLDGTALPVTSPIAITTDIYGMSRNASTPDMGAYEFSYTQFTVAASNNSPVCAGSNVSLGADPGNALSPTYSWTSPSQTIVAVTQNPTVMAAAGKFKVVVTDIAGCKGSDSTTVTVRARPTASVSGAGSVCDGSSVSVSVGVTGSGTISGTLSSGDAFSGIASTLNLNLTPASTTSYYVTSLSDAYCTGTFPNDAPDTLTVIVRQAGLWSGAVSTAWNVAGNWLCGAVPDPGTAIAIPSSLSRYPVISSGTVDIGDLTLQTGATITVSAATLQVEGAITGTGSVVATSGTIELNGSAAQTIPGLRFSGSTLKNLTINNAAGVSISDTVKVSGILLATQGALAANGRLLLLSSSTATALVDGSGSGSVTGNVTMQRYLPSGFGYRYLSSPFQSATVAELSNDINLSASFCPVYRYDESLTSIGWVKYATTSFGLSPLQGYAVNCGSSAAAKTLDISGIVNNGTVSSTLYNHNNTYTLGFNLVGNPYPSPIDWNASGGWTKTNIDNALYYFNASSTDQYTGAYSTYINGVSSDGIASNIIPSMQAFFIHVSNGSYPVNGLLSVNNSARVTSANPAFHKQAGGGLPAMLRLSAAFEDDADHTDYAALYLDNETKPEYEVGVDALKLKNTDERLPNLYALSSDGIKLSISGIPEPADTAANIPLGIEVEKEGWLLLKPALIQQLPPGLNVWLADVNESTLTELTGTASYRAHVDKGATEGRFFLVFSRSNEVQIPGARETLKAYTSGSSIFVQLMAERGTLQVRNAIGQLTTTASLNGQGLHEIKVSAASGVYVLTLNTARGTASGKVILVN